MFEPRKLIPFSIELCSAPTAVMTEMTEKTPMGIPIMVNAERSLFTPNEASAILMISLKSILFVAQGGNGIEARRGPRRRKAGKQSGHNRNKHAGNDQANGEVNRKIRECLCDSKTH